METVPCNRVIKPTPFLVTTWYFENASPQDTVLDFGFGNSDTATDGLVTQTASASGLNSSSQPLQRRLPGNVFICDGEVDCDGIATEDDCDDTDSDLLEQANDNDCDGTPTGLDCDDNDPAANLNDVDNDGYTTCVISTCFLFELEDSLGDGWTGKPYVFWKMGTILVV